MNLIACIIVGVVWVAVGYAIWIWGMLEIGGDVTTKDIILGFMAMLCGPFVFAVLFPNLPDRVVMKRKQ